MKHKSKFDSYYDVRNKASLLFLALFLALANLLAQPPNSSSHFKDPESLVKHLYGLVTFSSGETPDWEYVKTLFIKESNVVMRVGKNETTTLSLDGWVMDFENFIQEANVEATGFEEKIVKMKSMVFGDIAHVLVLYTSYIPGKSKVPREGVDSFHLIKKEGRWWIVSILNEIPTADRPKPDVLK